MFLHHIAIRAFGSGLVIHFRVVFGVLRNIDANRLEGVDGLSPALTATVTTGNDRCGVVGAQAQQDQNEGNADDWARGVHNGVLDILLRKECTKGGRHENPVDKVRAITNGEKSSGNSREQRSRLHEYPKHTPGVRVAIDAGHRVMASQKTYDDGRGAEDVVSRVTRV